MIFDTSNPYELQQMLEYARRLASTGAAVEVKRKAQPRSLAQNRYLHVLLGYFGSEYGLSLDEVKVDFYKRECNRELFERTAVNKRGREVKYLRSTSDLTSAEMALSIDRFRNWSASVAGIYLPAADEQSFIAYCEREIERNREFV